MIGVLFKKYSILIYIIQITFKMKDDKLPKTASIRTQSDLSIEETLQNYDLKFNSKKKGKKFKFQKESSSSGTHSILPIHYTEENFEAQTKDSIFMQKRKRAESAQMPGEVNFQKLDFTNGPKNSKKNFLNFFQTTKLTKLFLDKLNLNNIFRQPIDFNPYESKLAVEKDQVDDLGDKIPKGLQFSYHAIKLLYIIMCLFLIPLSIVFDQINQSEEFLAILYLGIFVQSVDIISLLLSNKAKIHQTYAFGISEKMFKILKALIIFSSILINLIHPTFAISKFFRMLMFLKIKSFLQILRLIQFEVITASHSEKYWDLFKVFLMNLLVCHILAIVLVSMKQLSPNDNWMMERKINSSPWFEQYIWSYYFGITIILTIGFGDFHAQNHKQALILIFISFFSVIFFGWNINYIGNLINSIREQESEKNQKLKVFNTLCKKANISKEVHRDISNYIIESAKIRKQFNHQKEKQLLQELPESLRSCFLQESNEKLFNGLKKVIPLSYQSIERLSLKIEAKICHPGQIIKRAKDKPCLVIVKNGQIGYYSKKNNSSFNNILIQTIKNSYENQSKIACNDFLKKEPRNFDIKSISYSVIYEMTKEQFQECLKSSPLDYQNYREVLDKHHFKLDPFGMNQCQFCKNKMHNLFECSRLHFKPIAQKVLLKHLKNKEHVSEQQKRVRTIRCKNNNLMNAFEYWELGDDKSSLCVQGSLKNIHDKLSNKGRRKSKNESSQQSSSLTNKIVYQLKEEIKDLRKSSEVSSFQFQLWDHPDLDQAHNFVYYFTKHNSDNLKSLYKAKTIQISSLYTRRAAKRQINEMTRKEIGSIVLKNSE